eukprot:853787-Rhodomonas_salina.2
MKFKKLETKHRRNLPKVLSETLPGSVTGVCLVLLSEPTDHDTIKIHLTVHTNTVASTSSSNSKSTSLPVCPRRSLRVAIAWGTRVPGYRVTVGSPSATTSSARTSSSTRGSTSNRFAS